MAQQGGGGRAGRDPLAVLEPTMARALGDLLRGRVVPCYASAAAFPQHGQRLGQVAWDIANKNFYVWNGTGWTIIGGGGSSAQHNLLSATHPDTVVGSPTRGALVVGNATPRWVALVLATAGNYLRSNGTDALWSTIQGADVPTTHAGSAHHNQSHGSADHTGKIGEVPFILTIPLAQPLASGQNQAVVDYEHRDWGNGVVRINRIYARARSNVTGNVTLKLYRNGSPTHVNDTVTISSGTRESGVTVLNAEITLADGDYLDVEQTTSVTDNIAVDFYVLGDQDVVAAV